MGMESGPEVVFITAMRQHAFALSTRGWNACTLNAPDRMAACQTKSLEEVLEGRTDTMRVFVPLLECDAHFLYDEEGINRPDSLMGQAEAAKKISDSGRGVCVDLAYTDGVDVYAKLCRDPLSLDEGETIRLDRWLGSLTEYARREGPKAYMRWCGGFADSQDVVDKIQSLEGYHDPWLTGFKPFDDVLGGGLPQQGLVLVGAASSFGKTTLCMQLATGIAERAGRDTGGVVFVTIEQGPDELAAKAISRRCWQKHGIAISAADLCSPSKRKAGGEKCERAVAEACDWYRDVIAPGLHIVAANNGRPTVNDVRKAILAARVATGLTPTVFIDYLQLLADPEPERRRTEKQVIDDNITALRQMAYEFGTCIIVIASFSRSGTEDPSLTSFSGSGGIDYGCDAGVLLKPDEDLRHADRAGKKDIEERYREGEGPDGTKHGILYGAKLRNGRNGIARHFIFEGAYSAFLANPEADRGDAKKSARRDRIKGLKEV